MSNPTPPELVPPAEGDGSTPPAEGDQFPRAYVEQLRTESAGYRERATTAESSTSALQARLHSALINADGRLADPTALPFKEEYLTDDKALEADITALISDQPNLKARQLSGDIGNGNRGDSKQTPPDLISLIRGR